MSTLYPTDLGPFDLGARWTIEETKHKIGCPDCLTAARVAGEALNEPQNAELMANSATVLDYENEVRRAPAIHWAMVRRERAQPWTRQKSRTGWGLGLFDRIDTPLDAPVPDRSKVYIDGSGDYNVHTEHGWQVVESGEMVVLFSPRNGRGGFNSHVIHKDGQNGPWRVLEDQAEADRARGIITRFNTTHHKAWARRAKKRSAS